MKLYRDQQGMARAEVENEPVMLAEFLTSDVQADVAATKELLALADHSVGEVSGNAHCLLLDGDDAVLENLFSDEVCRFERRMLIEALEQWLAFIDKE
ncbi:hypothetical protein SAMN04488540_11116 [Ferrimonas sediminum]|uniref:Uncharacterized protein n=1 Tax=Ferrimonas sediminum TaxID=718193 RepID=A0A1G8VE80_9GAMM|nr:hypothetical protein [Ferrimonas sediminum]SDJ64402.1 hypothetical protein SAMN04488540_11116 [Ferrimonas sediminum]